MSFWIILFAIAAGQGFFLAAVLFFQHTHRVPNRLLAGFLLLLAVSLGFWLLWWTGAIQKLPGLIALNFGFPLLYGPLLLLFYQATFEQRPLSWGALWHFVPFLLVKLMMLPFYMRFVAPNPTLIAAMNSIVTHPVFIASFFVQMIAYSVIVTRHFKIYYEKDRERTKWHWWVIGAYLGIVAAYLLYRLLPAFGLTAPEWKYLISLALTIFIYAIAWLGYVQPQLFRGIPLKKALRGVKYEKSPLTPEASWRLYEKLVHLMEGEALYRNSNLNLSLLAKRVGETRHYTSQAINEQTEGNFADFVNGYRIREAQQLLANTNKQEKNISEIAYEVGFNTKKAFNLAFKKWTGVTPTEYRKNEKSYQK